MEENRSKKYQEHRELCEELCYEYTSSDENSGVSFRTLFLRRGVNGALSLLKAQWDKVEVALLRSNPKAEASLVRLSSLALNTLVCLKSQSTWDQIDLDRLYRDTCISLSELYPVKNENYNDSFGKTVQHYGPISALTRMSDKWNRIETLLSGGIDKVGETVEDTLMDLADYSLMTVVELRRYNQRRQFEAIAKESKEEAGD